MTNIFFQGSVLFSYLIENTCLSHPSTFFNLLMSTLYIPEDKVKAMRVNALMMFLTMFNAINKV